MTAPIDYNAVLADLEAKRAQIDAAIQVIRALVGSGGATVETSQLAEATLGENGGTSHAQATGARPTQVPGIQSDTFFKMSTAAAIRKYLAMVKRPQKTRPIADALQAGGQLHARDAQTAYMNVNVALRRGKDKDFVQTRDGEWGLAEWYGNKPKSEGE